MLRRRTDCDIIDRKSTDSHRGGRFGGAKSLDKLNEAGGQAMREGSHFGEDSRIVSSAEVCQGCVEQEIDRGLFCTAQLVASNQGLKRGRHSRLAPSPDEGSADAGLSRRLRCEQDT